MSTGMGRRLVEDRQAEQARLASARGRAGRRTLPGRRRAAIGHRAATRHLGLALVRVGRRLAGPDDLLDRRLLLMSGADLDRR